MLRLAARRLWPVQPQPAQVFDDGGLEFRPGPRLVDILDAQQETAAGLARHPRIEEGGEGVAQMQPAVGARCETENGLLRHGDPACLLP